VTRLRKMMLEELQRRNYSQHTTSYYIRTVEDFARRFNRPPDRLGLRHIREYQAELFQKHKLSTGTVNDRLAALRFFYIRVWSSRFVQDRVFTAAGTHSSDSHGGPAALEGKCSLNPAERLGFCEQALPRSKTDLGPGDLAEIYSSGGGEGWN
jgi:site-specific recombinase XerD